MEWRLQAAEVFNAPDPLRAVMNLNEDARWITDLSATLVFQESPPAGWLVDELTRVDRAFRWGVRLEETGLSADEFFQRRSRPIPVRDGLIVESFVSGSLRVPLVPSRRIRKSLKNGILVGAAAMTFVTGAWELEDRLTDQPQSPPIPSPVEHELQLHIKRGNERIDIDLEGGESSDYQLLTPIVEAIARDEE